MKYVLAIGFLAVVWGFVEIAFRLDFIDEVMNVFMVITPLMFVPLLGKIMGDIFNID